MLLSAEVNSLFSSLTKPEWVKVLVLDDSIIKQNYSKAVELLAQVYDHVEHKYQKEFSLLTLGWSDGYILYQLVLTFFLLQRKETIIRKSLIKSSIARMVTNSAEKAFCQNRKQQSC